jgi:ABC-2 type transport system ATP-binding protein
LSTVEVRGLDQGYGRNTVLSGLNLELDYGAVGLLGPNGAGKTTLLRTLATAAPPRNGTLRLFDQDVTDEKSVRRARRDIGYLPQSFGYPPSFTVREFVTYCAWLREVPKDQVPDAVTDALKAVGLEDQARTTMKSLSGGMRQRAGIAACVAGRPRLLLLDEPTVGLDPAQRLEFRDVIRSLTGATIVLSTHLVEDVAAVCDTVLVMSAGRFMFRGTPQELADTGAGAAAASSLSGDSPIERGYMSVIGGIA